MKGVKKPRENIDLTNAIRKMRLDAGHPVVLKATESKALLKKLKKR